MSFDVSPQHSLRSGGSPLPLSIRRLRDFHVGWLGWGGRWGFKVRPGTFMLGFGA
jgi:hypothetical protein